MREKKQGLLRVAFYGHQINSLLIKLFLTTFRLMHR